MNLQRTLFVVVEPSSFGVTSQDEKSASSTSCLRLAFDFVSIFLNRVVWYQTLQYQNEGDFQLH